MEADAAHPIWEPWFPNGMGCYDMENTFETQFDELYKQTDDSFVPYRYERGVWRLSKSREYPKDLPFDERKHIRGWLGQNGVLRWFVGDEHDARIPRKLGGVETSGTSPIKDSTFHSQPTSDPYSDTPSWEDVYDFLYWRHREHTILGRKKIAVLTKSERTLPLVREILKWEGNGEQQTEDVNWARYNRKRLKVGQKEYKRLKGGMANYKRCAILHLLRLAKPILKAEKLSRSSRPCSWQNQWVKVFQLLGIEVEQKDRRRSLLSLNTSAAAEL